MLMSSGEHAATLVYGPNGFRVIKPGRYVLQTLQKNSSIPGNLAVWVGGYYPSSWAPESSGKTFESHSFASSTSS